MSSWNVPSTPFVPIISSPYCLTDTTCCLSCTCIHFGRALGSQAKRCFSHWPSHRATAINQHTAHSTDIGSGAGYCSFRYSTTRNSRAPHSSGRRLLVSGSGRRTKSTCDQVINFFWFVCGTMASSAVSSVLYMRDEAGNHAETRCRRLYIYYGDAASFHEWEFRTRLRIAGKSGDQCIEVMSKVCDGLRGDAFVAAQGAVFVYLCESIDGRPCGIDTLINHMRGMVFSLYRTRILRIIPTVLSSEDPCPDKTGEYDMVCLATTTLLDTPGSDGPSNSLQ